MVQVIDINKIQGNRENPRVIKDDKFKKLVRSIEEFPEMLYLRPIVVNQDMVILGGNMRHKAAKDAGLKEIPIIITDQTKQKNANLSLKITSDSVSGTGTHWQTFGILKN